jgi:ABC-2 type transport system ATP-binding protein
MIKIDNLTKKFGKTLSLDNVSIEFNKNDAIALMGANGAGKTTLIRLILGYYHANSGTVSVNGMNPIKQRQEILKHVSFVPQLPPPIKLSLKELMDYVCNSSDIIREDIFYYAKEMDFELRPNLNKSFFKLSGGMKQKMLIAISLAKKSDILIYDEPTANLDPKARDNFYRLLKTDEKDKLALFVTHRIEEVKEIVNREIYMDLGTIVSDKNV